MYTKEEKKKQRNINMNTNIQIQRKRKKTDGILILVKAQKWNQFVNYFFFLQEIHLNGFL